MYINNGVSVEEPHHTRPWVTGDAAAETCPFAFHYERVFWFESKNGFLLLLLGIGQLVGLSLPCGFHFTNLLHTLHALGKLRIVNDSWFAGRFDDGARLIRSVLVGGTANVFTAVLWVNPAKVHGHVTKIVDGSETCLVRQWFSIEEPLESHVRVTYRRQLALEFSCFHFLEFHHVLDMSHEPTKTEINV